LEKIDGHQKKKIIEFLKKKGKDDPLVSTVYTKE